MSQRNVPRHCFGAKTAQTRFINHNSPSPKKMARTTQSKILAISSNHETIMLLLIVGELWDPEVILWHEICVRAQPHFSQGTERVDFADLPDTCPMGGLIQIRHNLMQLPKRVAIDPDPAQKHVKSPYPVPVPFSTCHNINNCQLLTCHASLSRLTPICVHLVSPRYQGPPY